MVYKSVIYALILVALVVLVVAVGDSCGGGWGTVRQQAVGLFQKRKRPPVVIFYHVAQIGDWMNIVNEQVSLLRTSGLYKKADRIMVTVLGSQPLELPSKMEIVHRSNNLQEYEIVTINKMLEFSKSCTSTHYILYLHTKGVTKRMCNGVHGQYYWRQLMNYWNVERHPDMIAALDKGYLTAGINLMKNTWGIDSFHYSGNFWWASSAHLSTLAPLPSHAQRWDAEFWLLTRRLPRRHISLYGPYVVSVNCSGLYGTVVERKTYEDATQDTRVV